jgi:hypothetical protein
MIGLVVICSIFFGVWWIDSFFGFVLVFCFCVSLLLVVIFVQDLKKEVVCDDMVFDQKKVDD